MKKYLKGFTLVELIIVITILAILSSIGFVSFQNYTKSTRDSNRLTTMKSLETWLNLNYTKTQKYPDPDDVTTIQSSGVTIGYQGKVGDSVSKLIGINFIPLDPLDLTNYVYSVNSLKNRFQLFGYLESSDSLSYNQEKAFAANYLTRTPKSFGNNIGIILDSNNESISGSIFNMSSINSNYNVYFSDNDFIKSNSGTEIFSNMLNRRIDLTTNTSFSVLDSSLIGYWSFENNLNDSSSKALTLTGEVRYSNGVIGKAGQFGLIEGKNYKSQVNGYNSTYDIGTFFTVSTWLKKSSSTASGENRIVGNRYGWNNPTGWYIAFPTNEKVSVSIGSMSGVHIYSNNKLDLNAWYNVAFTFNNGRLDLYVNGEKQTSSYSGITYSPPLTYPLVIGALANSTNYNFNGFIDEVRIYNRALSEQEIKSLYNLLN